MSGQIVAKCPKEYERSCRSIEGEGQPPLLNASLVTKGVEILIGDIWLNILCQPEVYRHREAVRMCISYCYVAGSPTFFTE